MGGGWLEVVCGPMFCGKSEELIRRLRRAEIAGRRASIVKPLIDDRYAVGHVVSHAGTKIRAVSARRARRCAGSRSGYDAVGIDEVQFFDGGIVGAVDALVARRGARHRGRARAGLPRAAVGPDADAPLRRGFVDELEGMRHRCGGPATMTQRLVDGPPAPFGGETIQVGALDWSEARCRRASEPGEGSALRANGDSIGVWPSPGLGH